MSLKNCPILGAVFFVPYQNIINSYKLVRKIAIDCNDGYFFCEW